MASSNQFFFTIPNQAVEWQKTGGNVQHGSRRLLRGTRVHNSDAAVMASEGKYVSAGGEAHSVDPSSRVIQKFTTDSIERETLSPGARLRTGVDPLDKGRKDSSVRVGRSSSKQHRVRVPGKGSNSTSNRLLQVLRNPPVVFLFKVAYCDHTGSRTNGKLVLRWRPAHKCCSPVDSKEDQSRFPARRGLFPNVCVTI